jgi:hypothetical protein
LGKTGIVFVILGNADRKIFIERGAFSPRLVKGRAIVHRGRSKATDTKKTRGKFARPGSETPPGVRET